MRHSFYDDPKYQRDQANLTSEAWRRGVYTHLTNDQKRVCVRVECKKKFTVKPADPKRFCSQSCAAYFNNLLRVTKKVQKILGMRRFAEAKSIAISKNKVVRHPPLTKLCLHCNKEFITPFWQDHRYCSIGCSIRTTGGKPTSPKAARGKSGIRPDINPSLNFYSRWEANFARIMNFLGVEWIFQPKTFELEGHRYTPDFYLPEYDAWIEIKNFLSEYSRNRDEAFRRLYPGEALIMILKEHYLKLQEKFAPLIPKWEFSS